MEKNKKIGIMISIIAVLIITVLGTVYYFTEIKVDENGFNSHGIRELSKDRDSDWCDIELGTYILEITRGSLSRYDFSIREKTVDDYYNDKLKDFFIPTYAEIPLGDKYYRTTDGEYYSEDEIGEALKLECENEHYFEWRDNYIFNDVEVYFRFYFDYNKEKYATILISLNKDGTIESSKVYIDENYSEEIFRKYTNSYSDRKTGQQLYLNDGLLTDSYEVIYIHGSIERRQ